MNIFEMPVHPVAEIFPMLPDDELNELAEDIKINGLNHPIVVKDGVLIDGRNRREACRIAGIDPRIEELNGADPATFILSENINRRHMTKGQRAMAVAMMFPEPKRGMHSELNYSTGVDKGYISQARTVLKVLPELSERVIAGTSTLKEAYEEASEIRKKGASDETVMLEVKEKASDLADLVEEGRLSTREAIVSYRDRQRVEDETQRQVRESIYDSIWHLCLSIDALAGTAVVPANSFDVVRDEPDFQRRFRDGITIPEKNDIEKALKFIAEVKGVFE